MNSKKTNILVQGHRGARALLPENTLSGFSYCLKLGVPLIELDIHLTKDNQLVVIHDPFINSNLFLNSKGTRIHKNIPIRQITLKALKTYDCGSLKNPQFPKQKVIPGEKVPTLNEVFELISNKKSNQNVSINIEIKSVPTLTDLYASPLEVSKLVLDVVKNHGMSEQTWIQSFDHRVVKEMRKRDKNIKTSLLLSDNFVNAGLLMKDLKANAVSTHLKWTTPELVKDIHKLKGQVFSWTANTKKDWNHLIKCQVDSIITDDPAALMKYLKQ